MRPGYDKTPCYNSTQKDFRRNATGVRQSSMLQFYAKRISGEETKRIHQSTSATFVLPVRLGTCVAVPAQRTETDMLCGVMTKLKHVQKSADDLAIPTKYAFCTLRHGTCVALQTQSMETDTCYAE